MPSRTFTVCTLNTWKCDGRYRDRLELMTAEACRLRPDILLLQEAFAAPSLGLDTAAHLARALGYGFAVAPARAKPRLFEGAAVDSVSGLAVLSRGDIRSSRTVPLSDDARDGERISQVVELVLDGLRLLLVNMHLVYLPDCDDLRRVEMEETFAALPPLDDYDAAILAGDFNCAPDSAPIRWLLEESGLRIADACAAAGADFITREQGSTRPAMRMDDIFLLETGKESRFRVDRVERVFQTPDPTLGILPSDHYGVLATLERRSG